MEIVILDALFVNPGDIGWEPIERFGHVTVYENTPPELVAERLKDADFAFMNRALIGEAELSAAPKLKFIGLFATGYDKIDLEAARRHHVAVCNAPGYSTESVAQHAVALLLAITNRAAAMDAEVRKGRWTAEPGDCSQDAPLTLLSGKTFGVLGTGAIGCAAARIAAALGMHVIGHSRTEREEFTGTYVSLDELLRQSDVLSLHCAASEETRGVIDRVALEKMKPSAILINTARGALINEADLIEALDEGRLFAAGLDVCQNEPLTKDAPLLKAKNCLVTPHAAWIPLDTRRKLIRIVAENLGSFLGGGELNRVD